MKEHPKGRRLQNAAVTSRMEKVADALEIPKEFLAGTVKLTVTGDSELSVEGNLSVIEYSDNLLSIASSGLILTVEGENFEVPELDVDYLKLTGKIRGLSYIS